MISFLIIGGGVIGMLTALELAQAGQAVTLLERNQTGMESSWAGGGIVSPLYPWRYAPPVNALAQWSQAAYPALCEEITARTGISPEYTISGLLTLDGAPPQAQAWARDYGQPLQVLNPARLRELEPALGLFPDAAAWMPEIAQVRNPRLTASLKALLGCFKQVEIREQAEVGGLLIEQQRVAGVTAAAGEIRAERVIIAAGAWSAKLLAGTPLAVQPVRGQMILFNAPPGLLRHIVLHRNRYLIPRRDGRILIGSTLEYTDFDKSVTAEARANLWQTATTLVPALADWPIEQHWAGLRPGSPNGIPYVGPHPTIAGLYLNAGHFRNGIVTAPASARLLADILLDRPPILDPQPYAVDAPRQDYLADTDSV